MDILKSSSETSSSTLSLPTKTSQPVKTTQQLRNVNTLSSKRPSSHILDTSSTTPFSIIFPPISKLFTTDRPPMGETHINLSNQSQQSPIHTSLVHIPLTDSVARFIKHTPHKPDTAILKHLDLNLS